MKHLALLLLTIFFCSCNESSTTNYKTGEQVALTDQETQSVKDTVDNTVQENKSSIPETLEAPLIVQGFWESIPPPPTGNAIIVKGKKPPFDPTKPFTIIENGKRYEGRVCINYKEFSGISPYNIPFIITVLGSISEIYVDEKKVNEYKGVSGEIFIRRKIALEFGYNRIPVKVVGISGKTTESYIEITIKSSPDKIEIKITE